ncbi:hypothetical protein DRF75_04085, partial [Ehrlichia minasensis]
MYQQQPGIESIKILLNSKLEKVAEVSVNYIEMWEYIYWAHLIRSDDYLDTINLVRKCDKEHDIFHHAVMCNPEVFISKITAPKFSSVLQSIKDKTGDCKTIELGLLNGYALSVIVADPLFEEFRLKVTSVRIGGINLCQDIYNEVKEKNSSRGIDKCSEEDVDFLVRGVMYESHIKEYLHLFPNLIYLDCVVAEQKCCEVLFETLQHCTPKLHSLSLKCANAIPAVEWEVGRKVSTRLKVKDLLLTNCSVDALRYFSEVESLFIIAPQNLPENRKILLHNYYDNPCSVAQLLVSTNSYMIDSDGKMSCVDVDYDVMSFRKLTVLAINPCQDMSSILYMDGLWDTKAGLSFIDQLITSKKYNLLSGIMTSHPSSLDQLFFITSPIHKFALLEDSEKLFLKSVSCNFRSATSLIKSLGVGYLVPHFSYSKFGASKRDLQLIQLRLKISKALKNFDSELFTSETIYDDIIKYITRLTCDVNEVGNDQSASDKFLKNVFFKANFCDAVSAKYLTKIVSMNFPITFCGEFFGGLLPYAEGLDIYLVSGIGAFIREKFLKEEIKTLADLKDALLVFQKGAQTRIAGANEAVSQVIGLMLLGDVRQNAQSPDGSVKALCLSKLDSYSKEILSDVVGVANVLQMDKSKKIISFVESALCKTVPSIMKRIILTMESKHVNLIGDFWHSVSELYDDEFTDMLPNNYLFCKAISACSTITSTIEDTNPYVRAFLLMDNVKVKLVELEYGYVKLRIPKFDQSASKVMSILAVLTFLRQVLNFSGMSDEKILCHLSACGVEDFMSMTIVVVNLAFNELRNFKEQRLIADHRDLGFYESLNQAFIQHKISHEFMIKVLSDVLANTVIEVVKLYELYLVPLLDRKVQRLVDVIGHASQDTLRMKNVISAYIMSVRDVFFVKNDLYHFVEDKVVGSDVEMFNSIKSFSPVSRRGLLDILNMMFCARESDVSLLIQQRSSCVFMRSQPIMKDVNFSFKNSNRYRFLYRAINTMYIPYEEKYEDSFAELQNIGSVPIVLVSLLFQKIFYSYAKNTIDRQLLFKILYKFQHYFYFQFIQYCFVLPQVLQNDSDAFIYVKQSQYLVQVLRRIEPEVIISTIDNAMKSECDITGLYNTVLSSLVSLDKNAVPALSSKEKSYFSKMVDLFQTNFETHQILNGDVMRIISIRLTFEDFSVQQSKCYSDCVFASFGNIKMLNPIQGYCDHWIADVRNQVLKCTGLPDLNVLDIRNDLVNRCKNVEGVNDLTYQLILDKLEPSILPVQYLDEIACCIVLDLVQRVVDNEYINVFYEKLVDALVSRKKLGTMKNICETVLQTLKDFLLNKDKFLVSVSSHRQTSPEKEQKAADSLLSQCFAEWCYVILENLFKGKNLANSIKSYSIAQFVNDNGLPESALLDLEKRMKQGQQSDKYLRLINRFKSICIGSSNRKILDRVGTVSRQVEIFNIENSKIVSLMQEKLLMSKDNPDCNILKLLNVEQYDLTCSKQKSVKILKIVAMMFYALKPCNKQPISVHQYVCDNVYISLMKMSLMSVFFDENVMSTSHIISIARALLSMFSNNPYFVDVQSLDISENIMKYVAGTQYGDFEDKTPQMICHLGFHLVWEMLGILLRDLVLNCLSDVDSSLRHAEDYFKRLNNIDDYTMLLVKFYHRNVLFRYSKQISADNNLELHPVVFLCKFLKVFDYDLLKYYFPEFVLTLANVNISKDQISGIAATNSLESGAELSELDGNSVSKKQRSRKKSKKKGEQVCISVAGEAELMPCDEKVEELIISTCLNDLPEGTIDSLEVKDSDHLLIQEENVAAVTGTLNKNQVPSDQVENEKEHQDKRSEVQKSSKKSSKKAKKNAASKDKIVTSVSEKIDVLPVNESVSNECDVEEKAANDIKVDDALPEQEKESSAIVIETLTDQRQESADVLTSEQVFKKEEDKVQKSSKKSSKKAKKNAVSKDKIVASVSEKIDVLPVNESVSNECDVEEKAANDIKVDDALPEQEKESSAIVIETLTDQRQESADVLTSEQVLNEGVSKVQCDFVDGKDTAESKENEVVELASIVEESINESLNRVDSLEGEVTDGDEAQFKGILLVQDENSDGQELLTKSLSRKASKKARKLALKVQEGCKKSERKAQQHKKRNNVKKIVKAEAECTSVLEDRCSSVSPTSKESVSNVITEAIPQSSNADQDCEQLQVSDIKICDEILHTHRSDLEKLFGSYDEQRLRFIIESIGIKNLISTKIINVEMKRIKRIAASDTSLDIVMPSLRYTSSLYRIKSESMCGLRFSHFLYSVQLIDSLFEVVNSNSGSSKVVVKGAAHKVLKNVFGYRKDYNFFIILMKVFILLNLSTAAISHSDVSLKTVNVYFKHSCDVFKMDLNPIMLEVMQVLESIKGQEIALYQLQNCMSKIFCKFFKESMPRDNYPLRFLKSLLSILSIITVDTSLANDNDLRIVRDAAMFGCIVYIGSMSQQYTVQYWKLGQENHPFKQLTYKNKSCWFMQEDYNKVINLVKLFNALRNRLVHCYDSENEKFAERFKTLSSQGRCFNSRYDIADVLPAGTGHKCSNAWHSTSDFFASLSITALQTELLLITDNDCDPLEYSFLNRMYAFFQRCSVDIYPNALSERVDVDADKVLALIRLRTALSTFCDNSTSEFRSREHYVLSLNRIRKGMQRYCDNKLFSADIKRYTTIGKLLEERRAISFDADSMSSTSPVGDNVDDLHSDRNSHVFKKQDVGFDTVTDFTKQSTAVDVKLEMSPDTNLVRSMQCGDNLSVDMDCGTGFTSPVREGNNTSDMESVPSCSRLIDVENSNSGVTGDYTFNVKPEVPSYSRPIGVEGSNRLVNVTGRGHYTSDVEPKVHDYSEPIIYDTVDSLHSDRNSHVFKKQDVGFDTVTDFPKQGTAVDVKLEMSPDTDLVRSMQCGDNLSMDMDCGTGFTSPVRQGNDTADMEGVPSCSRLIDVKNSNSGVTGNYTFNVKPEVPSYSRPIGVEGSTRLVNATRRSHYTSDARPGVHSYSYSMQDVQCGNNLPGSVVNTSVVTDLSVQESLQFSSNLVGDVQCTNSLAVSSSTNLMSLSGRCFDARSRMHGYNEPVRNAQHAYNPLVNADVSDFMTSAYEHQRDNTTYNARFSMHGYGSPVEIVQPSSNLPGSQLSENTYVQNYSAFGARPKMSYGGQQ